MSPPDLRDDIDRLQAHVRRLKAENTEMIKEIVALEAVVTRLQAENDRLEGKAPPCSPRS